LPSRRQLKIAIVVPVACLALVLALRLWLQWVGPLPGDRWALTRNDYNNQSATMLDLGNFFQVIGTPLPAVITVAWASVFVRRAEGARGVAFVLLAACAVFFNSVLKELSGTTPLAATKFPGALNYPSGHVAYATAVFGSVAVLAWRHRRYDIVAVLVFLIALMGPFRVSIGAHQVSDVIAAYLVGIAWLVPLTIVLGYGGEWASREPVVQPAGAT
jgi:membrane-associated phospholipid phosphatase